MPPNKHDLGAKIQILNPNAPNYLLLKKIIEFRMMGFSIQRFFCGKTLWIYDIFE